MKLENVKTPEDIATFGTTYVGAMKEIINQLDTIEGKKTIGPLFASIFVLTGKMEIGTLVPSDDYEFDPYCESVRF